MTLRGQGHLQRKVRALFLNNPKTLFCTNDIAGILFEGDIAHAELIEAARVADHVAEELGWSRLRLARCRFYTSAEQAAEIRELTLDTMVELETRSATTRETMELGSAELRFADDAESGEVEAASPLGRLDSYRTVIDSGAFASAVGRRVPMLYGHDSREVIGSWTVERVDDALRLRGKLNMEVARAREVRALVKAGDLPGISVGFKTLKDERKTGGIRHITSAELMEVSFVAFPAIPGASVTGIRSSAEADFAAFTRAVRRAAASLRSPK